MNLAELLTTNYRLGDTLHFRFAPWLPFAVGAIAAAFLFVSIRGFVQRRGERIMGSIAGTLFGLMLAAVLAPGLLLDRVTVDASGVSQDTGFWWKPASKRILAREVEWIQVTEDSRGREVWLVSLKRGEARMIDPGDLWSLNSEQIAAELRRRGVVFR